jgi:cysteine-S-conjugate beta-lyase
MIYNFDEVIDRSHTGAIKYDARREYFQKDDVIPMWIADMDFATPPFIIDAITKRLEHQVLGYTLRQDGFYQSIISWMKTRHQWPIEKEWIVFSPGIVPAVSMSVLAFTQPGDKIIIQPPVYPPFFWCIKNNRREIVENPLIHEDGYYKMDFDDLEQKARVGAKVLIFCSPHNPVGRVWLEDELKKMVEICKKYDILILSDDIHADLVFSPHKHIPLQLIAPEYGHKIITCIAPSKTFNLAGMSTSAVIIPDGGLRKQLEDILETIHVGMGNIFGFVALEAAYQHGHGWLDQVLDYLKGNITYVKNFLNENIPDISFHEPEATYLLWLDFRKLGMADKELTEFLIHKAGIGPSPGSIFGNEGEGFQRINIASPRSMIVKAMDQLAEAFAGTKD